MKRRFWTNTELDFIRENILDLGADGCAKALGRSKSSVQHKMSKEGIFHPIMWSKNDERKLIEVYHTIPTKEIGKIFGRTANQVQSKARNLGIAKANFYPEDRFCLMCGQKLANKYMKPSFCKGCVGKTMRGPNNPMWKGGVRTITRMLQSLLRPWKKKILKRDLHQCRLCENIENLNVHHIRRYRDIRDRVMSEHPELNIKVSDDRMRLAVLIASKHKMEDGITLCYPCHVKVHSEKRGELLENPNGNAEDNQQPSALNVSSTVDAKVQRLTGEESQPISPTRAPRTLPTA